MLTDPEEDYARGFVPFLGVNVFLDSRPLIPRTETEWWVEKAIQEMKNLSINRKVVRVLDLFAGSGAVGLAVLRHVPRAHVTFGELEPRHFPTIEKSIEENRLDRARSTLVETDVWSSVEGVFDVVLANPPYLSRDRKSATPSVEQFEPPEALFADNDGFALLEKTIAGLSLHLAEGGIAYLEHEPFHATRLRTVAAQAGLTATTHDDQYGVARFTTFCRG